MTAEQAPYHAYLLRLWLANNDPARSAIWLASLENPHTGEQIGFASLEQLFAYLMDLTEAARKLRATHSAEAEDSATA